MFGDYYFIFTGCMLHCNYYWEPSTSSLILLNADGSLLAADGRAKADLLAERYASVSRPSRSSWPSGQLPDPGGVPRCRPWSSRVPR